MSARVEAAIERLYEDSDLRDELTDDEAQHLLRWAEAELSKVDASSADETAFETAVDTLGSLIKSINRFIGRRSYSTPDEQAAAFAKIADHAQSLGYPLPADAFTASFEAQAAADNVAALQALLSQIETSAAPAAQAAPAPSAPETPPAPPAPPAPAQPPAFSSAEPPAEAEEPAAPPPPPDVPAETAAPQAAAWWRNFMQPLADAAEVVSSAADQPPDSSASESGETPEPASEDTLPGDDSHPRDEHPSGDHL